jgi:hypothetical protein
MYDDSDSIDALRRGSNSLAGPDGRVVAAATAVVVAEVS